MTLKGGVQTRKSAVATQYVLFLSEYTTFNPSLSNILETAAAEQTAEKTKKNT